VCLYCRGNEVVYREGVRTLVYSYIRARCRAGLCVPIPLVWAKLYVMYGVDLGRPEPRKPMVQHKN